MVKAAGFIEDSKASLGLLGIKLGAPGLKASVTYLSGDPIDSASGDQQEWERDLRLDYSLQDGALKDLGFTWRNASLRGNAAADQDENRLIVSYSLPLL